MKRVFYSDWLVVLHIVALVGAQQIDDDALNESINELSYERQEFYDREPYFPASLNVTPAVVPTAAGCTIEINNNGQTNPPPLLIHPNTEHLMHPTTSDGIVRLAFNQNVELFCSVDFKAPFVGAPMPMIATCMRNNLFQMNGHHNVVLNTVRCSAHARHVDRRLANRKCGAGNYTLLELGFHVTATRFLRLMEVCHDERLHSTLYTRYRLTPANVGFQRAFPRPGFIKGTFFRPLNVNRLYSIVTQRQTIGRILGAQRVAQLFDKSRNFFLTRGHLAAKTDFIFGAEQRGTFFFVNAAPQWQSFNEGNWERIESGIKQHVANRQMNVQVYTGTLHVLRMPDQAGNMRELYLGTDATSGLGLIPVPLYFYKVVVEERLGIGIVFIGLNNPHVNASDVRAGRYNLCRDIGDQVTYVNWNRVSLAHGYSYACEVNEFMKVIGHLPVSVRATRLLL